MRYFGISANLMSLGGLAIALGLAGGRLGGDGGKRRPDAARKRARASRAFASWRGPAARWRKPIAFSLLIIVIVFLPLFTLQGVEGKTFTPLAQTMSFAMLGSLIFAMSLAPVLASLLMRRPKGAGQGGGHKEFFVVALAARGLSAGRLFFRRSARLCRSLLAVALLVSGRLPVHPARFGVRSRLNEGDLMIRATMAPSISLEEARDTMQRFEQRLMKNFPEVDDGRDPRRPRRSRRARRSDQQRRGVRRAQAQGGVDLRRARWRSC